VAPAVAGLTRELDGIPLALELAAAQAHVMTPQEMLRQLGRRFRFLVGLGVGTTTHHRSLRAALDWSYELLSTELRAFFAELSVFRGGWNAEAAEEVCGDPDALGHLGELRRSSMVQAEEHAALGVMRFRMLNSLREYAAEKLPAERERSLRQRHAQFCLSLAGKVTGEGADKRPSALLELDTDNLRAAGEWLASVGRTEEAQRLDAVLHAATDGRTA